MTTSAHSFPNLTLLAPVRIAKGRVVPPRPDIPRPSSEQLTEAIEVVRATNWVDDFSILMPDVKRAMSGDHPGGRKAEMSMQALLVGCLLLAIMERPMIIRDVHRLLHFGIDAGTRKRLGLDPKRAVTERMVSRLFNNLAATINPSVFFESNAWLFDEKKVCEVLGVNDDDTFSDWDHAHYINERLNENVKRLDGFIRAGLRATHPLDSKHAGDYCIDGSYISSWERSNTRGRARTSQTAIRKDKKRKVRFGEFADPDARRRATSSGTSSQNPDRKKYPGKKPFTSSLLGYCISAVTWAEDDLGPNTRGPDIPNLIEHLSVVPADRYATEEGSNVIDRMVAHHEREDALAGREQRDRGDILADRAYSCDAKWQKRMHFAGFTPHFLLTKTQHEVVATLYNGVVVMDGIPYSPGIPEHLRTPIGPGFFANRTFRASNAAYYLQRKPYRIKAYGGAREDDGSIKAYCGASSLAKSAIRCPNKPSSIDGRFDRVKIGNAMPVLSISPLYQICAQTSLVIPFDELPFWQPHIPGTPEHQWSVNRRNTVEGNFSRIKDEATQSMRRGQVRLMGIAKMSMATAFYAMASNLLEVARWRLREAGVYSLDAQLAKSKHAFQGSTLVPAKLHSMSETNDAKPKPLLPDWLRSQSMSIP